MPNLSTYAASKAFLSHFLESIRHDVGPLGIVVTVLQPGYIKTDLTSTRKPETMPFLMEFDAAIAHMTGAIDRQADEYTFPWQMAAGMKTAAALPGKLRMKAIKRIS